MSKKPHAESLAADNSHVSQTFEGRLTALEREMARQAGVTQLKSAVDQLTKDVRGADSARETGHHALSQKLDDLHTRVIELQRRMDMWGTPTDSMNKPKVV